MPTFVDLGITSPPYNKKEKNKGWLVNSVKYDAAPISRRKRISSRANQGFG